MTDIPGVPIQRNWFRTLIMTAAVLLSILCLLHGFVSRHIDFTGLWRPDGLARLERFTAIYWVAFLSVYLSDRRFVRPVALAAALGVATIVAGPWAIFSVAAFFFGCWALGALLVKDGGTSSYLPGETDLFRLCAGLVIVEAAMYATSRIKVHYPPVILAFLLLPGFFAFRQLRPKLNGLFEYCRASTGSAWQVFSEGLLSYILFCSLLLALSPEVGSDALAMHLAVGTDMAAHHRFTFTPDVVSWSAMPLGADYCFAIACNLAGEIAARLENFGLLIFLLTVLFRIGRRFTTRTADLFLVLAMFASCSLAQFAVDSLVVENLWALLCAAMFLAVLKYYQSGRDRYVLLCSLLGGGAMMTKFGSLAFLIACVPFVGIAIWHNWNRGKFGKARLLSIAGLVLLGVSAVPYAIAYSTTGNPVFPFLNATWKSPLLNTSANLIDFRWRAPIRSTILFDLTFKTPKYLESRVGGFGFTFLLFALPCCAAISRKWNFTAIACVSVPLVFAVLTFHEVRYVRYLYPGLAILTPLMVYPLRESHRLNRGLYAILALLAVAGTGLNYYFVPAFSGYEAAFYSLTRSSREQYMQAYYRPAEAIRYLNRVAPDGSTLFVDSVDIAGLTGRPYALWWHFYPVAAAVKNAGSVAEVKQVLAAYSIQYVVHSTAPEAKWRVRAAEEVRQYPWSATYVPLLFNEFLQTCTNPVFSAGGWEVRKIHSCKLADRSTQS